MKLKEQLKKTTEKVTKLDSELKKFKEESCSLREDNAKLKNKLNQYELEETNLSVSRYQCTKNRKKINLNVVLSAFIFSYSLIK